MGIRLLIILAVTCLSFEIVSAATDKVVCYHGTWSKYRIGNGKFAVNDIDASLCTHVIYAFVGINSDGSIKLLDSQLDINNGNFANFVGLKKRNSALKTLLAVGGWAEGSVKYSAVAASASARATFIQSSRDLVLKHGFDGFDIDWEYPGQRGGAAADKKNYVTLIKEFRAEFDKHGLILTAAVAAAGSSVDLSYDVPSLSKYLDLINVMAYDLHGAWEGVTGQNAPLYPSSIDKTASTRLLNVNASIHGWIERGADPQKLALGLPLYGRSYTLSSSSNTALGAPVTGVGAPGPYTQEGGALGYNEICEKQLAGGWTTVWDDEQKVPYMYKGDQWVSYDNARSLAIKVNYAKSLNLGGVMVWSVETEDFLGLCGTKYPLLNAIKSALGTSDENIEDNDKETTTTAGGATTSAPAEDAAVPNDKPGSPTCKRTGYIKDPSDCSIFYYCLAVGSTYVPIKQQCNSGLYYDESAQVCNWPALVSGC